MPVDESRHPGSIVAQHVRNFFERYARCGENRGRRVPRLVRVPGPESRSFGHFAECATEVRWINRTADCVGEG